MQPPPKWISNRSLLGSGENLDWLGFETAKNHNRNPFVIGGTYHTCRFSWTARPHVEDVLLPSLGYWGFRDLSVNAWSCSTVPAFFLIVFSWGVLALCWCFEFAIASGLNSQKNSWRGIYYTATFISARAFQTEFIWTFKHSCTDFLHCACAYSMAIHIVHIGVCHWIPVPLVVLLYSNAEYNGLYY